MSDTVSDLDPDDWRRLLSSEERAGMLDDIARVSLSVGTRLFPDQHWQDLDVSMHTVAMQKSPFERLGFIAHLLPGLTRAIRQIEQSPLTRLTAEKQFVRPAVRAKRIGTGALLAAARRGPGLRSLEETRTTLSYDTLENRAVRAFCALLEHDCQAIVQIASAEDETEAANRAAQCTQQLHRLCKTTEWWDVTAVPEAWLTAPTQRASHRPDYGSVFRAAARYRRGFQFAWDQPLLTLPPRDTWRLYEAWCLVQVVTALETLGYAACEVDWLTVREGRLAFTLAVGEPSRVQLRSRTGRMLSVTYNQTFAEGRYSLSHTMQPDIALSDGQHIWILDAKFKAYADPGDEGTDINQMHAYRDAITDGQDMRIVAKAWCLYPGQRGAGCPSQITYSRSAQAATVGALRLRPGDSVAFTTLCALLAHWLAAPLETVPPASAQT